MPHCTPFQLKQMQVDLLKEFYGIKNTHTNKSVYLHVYLKIKRIK